MKRKTLAELKHIRDSWADEHEMAIKKTNAANKHERTSLKRFQQAETNYQKALAREPGRPLMAGDKTQTEQLACCPYCGREMLKNPSRNIVEEIGDGAALTAAGRKP